jgi:hypothetical protein
MPFEWTDKKGFCRLRGWHRRIVVSATNKCKHFEKANVCDPQEKPSPSEKLWNKWKKEIATKKH